MVGTVTISSLLEEVAYNRDKIWNRKRKIGPVGENTNSYLDELWHLGSPRLSSAPIQERDEEPELGEETNCPEDTAPLLMHLVRQGQSIETEKILNSPFSN